MLNVLPGPVLRRGRPRRDDDAQAQFEVRGWRCGNVFHLICPRLGSCSVRMHTWQGKSWTAVSMCNAAGKAHLRPGPAVNVAWADCPHHFKPLAWASSQADVRTTLPRPQVWGTGPASYLIGQGTAVIASESCLYLLLSCITNERDVLDSARSPGVLTHHNSRDSNAVRVPDQGQHCHGDRSNFWYWQVHPCISILCDAHRYNHTLSMSCAISCDNPDFPCREVAKLLAGKGAHVVLAVRDLQGGERVLQEIR